MNEPARTLKDRYLLEATIGRGGMGVVHRARDKQLDRLVAVKLVSEIAAPAAKDRFLTEARRTANVRHPSIVEVFDVGEDGDDAFLVMELLEGKSLSDRLEADGKIPPAEAVVIAAEICDALAAAHDAGLVHRDLKPANVFLLASPTAGRHVKLLDFGIAKRIDGATARTDPNVLVGTLEYMAPEQIRGTRVDGRADLYALGMTLYRMLTGTPAFTGDNVAMLVHQHLSITPALPCERAPSSEIPAWLGALVMRLLAKEPEMRPASARDVKRALVEATASTAQSTASPVREGMRMLEDDGAGDAAALELDLGAPPVPPADVAARPIARVPQRLPVEAPPSLPAPVVAPPLPGWIEPLAHVPIAVSKRVTGYSLLVLALSVVFFHAGLVFSLTLLLVAALGAVSMWASFRASR